MKFFYKAELKLGKYAVKNLMTYLIALYASGFVISLMLPQVYYSYLALDVPMILKGQVWRLITWLMYPPSGNIIFGALMLWVYYSIGTNVEKVWGSFRFNIFIFSGIIFHIIAAFVVYAIWHESGISWILVPNNLNLSILLAFIITFPESRFYLFFILPVKAWWLGVLYAVVTLINFITGGPQQKITIVLSLLNVLLFLVMTGKLSQIIRNVKVKNQKWK